MVTSTAAATSSKAESIRNYLQPDLKVVVGPIADLIPPGHRVRKPGNRQIQKCAKGIELFGFIQPVLIKGEETIDGEARMQAARRLGLKEIPCISVEHLNERGIRALRIAINKIQETGEWDEGALRLELAYQLEFKVDLADLGFEPPELDAILEIGMDTSDEPDPADVFDHPDDQAQCITREGDIWQLGDHIISCGTLALILSQAC